MRHPLIAVMVLLATASLAAQSRRDTTPPTVSLTAPAQGAVVAASVALSATARDNVRVSGVQFLVDGVTLGLQDTLAPYTQTWNTTAVANGPHTISARARDSSGNRTTATITVTVRNGTTPPPCTLAATATAPGSAAAGVSVSFTASATASNCTGTIAYGWSFGDGATASARTATHTYAAVGVYGWTMTASVAGVSITKTGTISIVASPPPPTCTLTATATVPATATAGASVPFTSSATATNCTGTVSYAWNFGDSGTAATQSTTHVYASAAVYGWTMTASVAGVTAVKTGGITVTTGSGDWILSWSDEFDGTMLDGAKWITTYPEGSRTNNDEMEWYVDDDGHHVVSGGTLKLVATKGSAQPGFAYSSGMICSYPAFAQAYGRFEVRMKIPKGAGMWPAFWLLPLPLAWPPEIDIMENIGDPTTQYLTNHWSANYPLMGMPHGGQAGSSFQGPDASAGFHVFAVEWTPTDIRWYFDGVQKFRVTDHVPVTGYGMTGMYILLNLAVGGSWPGPPNASTVFPATLEVDYVRVYRR